MADHAIATRKAPLAGRRGGSPAAILTPAEPASRISLRAGPDAVPALSAALGVTIPVRSKTSASTGRRHVLWLGPDEWLVIDEDGADLMAAAASSGTVHSAVDVSHRNTAVIVSGAGAEAAINSGCPQDLSLAIFPVGACSRTIFGKAEIVLFRTAEDTFRVECWRSFSSFVFGLLAEGAEDAGH
ncbi:sarcosine oxidase subunit gamma family protein [Sinorhizobium meliloti]|jgi:sarcosine oxidase, subunit gamma|uniref:Sarcosine oxidase subunit gamma n=1 Tax=Rhizobium meliloti TaxID=382 RepID=A0A2J0YZU8_RHIML|nr:sarcosine oxidase subunit gamma [Sinorhizobium meliloti]PJR13803.1 sarcosine oxidase subunit gamma [Sinorhizobium meliloti]GCA47762.1 sarcosine oxidase, gamma subunit family [Sinorhizobium sp. KGO-5]